MSRHILSVQPPLQTTSSDLRSTLVFIWAKILALDKSCQVGVCVSRVRLLATLAAVY